MVDVMEPDVQEYCVECICEIELKKNLPKNSDILDLNLDICIANYYETTQLALYMKPKDFCVRMWRITGWFFLKPCRKSQFHQSRLRRSKSQNHQRNVYIWTTIITLS